MSLVGFSRGSCPLYSNPTPPPLPPQPQHNYTKSKPIQVTYPPTPQIFKNPIVGPSPPRLQHPNARISWRQNLAPPHHTSPCSWVTLLLVLKIVIEPGGRLSCHASCAFNMEGKGRGGAKRVHVDASYSALRKLLKITK